MKRVFLSLALLASLPAYAATVIVPGTMTPHPLYVSTVTTGGTAVTAIVAGGWIQNPSSATVNLCINEVAVASGTTLAGSLTCLTLGQTYRLAPSLTPVSVVSSDSAHPFSGMGFTL